MRKNERTDGVYVLHIVESFQDIQSFLKDRTYDEFVNSKLLQNAVIRSFEIAGEATKNLTDDFRNAHCDIDWTGMAGFRDVLIHQYFGIDLPNVWDAVQHFVPDTLPKLHALEEFTSTAKVLG